MTELRVQTTRSSGFHINKAKTLLAENETITLEAVGRACTVAMKAANALVSFGYCQLQGISTGVMEDGKTILPTSTVKLGRTEDFQAKVEEWEKTKEKTTDKTN